HISHGEHGVILGSRVTHSQVISDPLIAGILPALRDLVSLRARQEIADYVSTQLAGDPLREVIAARLAEECATLADAQARLPREREYLAALRRAYAGAAVGKGLVENEETGGVGLQQARARALAGLSG
ncbi:MAG: hypothetical protein QHJ73_11570, partial [Armatimonadota bacterium]|nr:hypothetical protein [Armatimonadota bacterium]